MSIRATVGLVLVCAIGGIAPARLLADKAEQGDGVDEIDYVALAARLLRDGHHDRAAAALSQVNVKHPGLDLRRFHTLRGLVALKQHGYGAAVAAFEAAIKAAPPADEVGGAAKQAPAVEPALFLYLAQSHFGLKQYAQTLAALKRGGEGIADEPSVYLMSAQANWELKHPAAAFKALAAGERRFRGMPEFARMPVFFLVELGLFQEALVRGLKYLERADVTADDYVAVAEALRKGQQPQRAGRVLERAHLRFPGNETILLALAHTYIDREQPLSAAGLLEDAARINPKYTVEAAELYKEAGRAERALSLNARVTDQTAKLRQRLASLLKLERYELVSAMAPSLARVGLLQEEQVRYALAYGYYKAGDFASAEKHLKLLSSATFFESANQLRKAMERCRESGWECS